MKEKIIKPAPGTLMGLVTTKAFPGKSLHFYDGTEFWFGVPLNKIHSYTPEGIPEKEFEDKFFTHSLHIKYPEEASEEDFDVFIGR